MPLVSVVSYRAAGGPAAGTGVQTVGTLTLPSSGNAYVEFDYDLWKDAVVGVAYPLFNYTTLTGSVATLTPVFLGGLSFSGASFSDNGSGTISVTFS